MFFTHDQALLFLSLAKFFVAEFQKFWTWVATLLESVKVLVAALLHI